MPTQVVRADPLRTVAFGSITNSYTLVGSVFSHATRLVHMVNNTNADMIISFDSVNDHVYIPAGSFALYDLAANREENILTFVFIPGTGIYIKYNSAPTSGNFAVTCLYGQGE